MSFPREQQTMYNIDKAPIPNSSAFTPVKPISPGKSSLYSTLYVVNCYRAIIQKLTGTEQLYGNLWV